MICKICNKEFESIDKLNNHIHNIHKVRVGDYMIQYENAIYFNCDICNANFINKIVLGVHKKKIHNIKSESELKKEKLMSLNKNFKCDICNEDFITKTRLAIHKKEIHKIKSIRELQKERIDSLSRDIKCNECGKAFHRLSNLSQHIKKIHNILPKEYYLKYMMKENDHINCKECGKPNGFRFDYGFNDFCSFSCSTSWYAKNTNRVEVAMKTLAKRKEENPDYHLSTSQERYWILKGFTETEAKQKVHERQKTFSKEIMIEKHGEEDGIKKWTERQEKWQTTLLNKSPEELERIARAKMGNGKGYSAISQELFDGIMFELPINLKAYYATRFNDDIKSSFKDNWEYMIMTEEKKMMFLDFYIPSINLCIEFDGDYWHGEERGNKDRDRLREKAIIIENPNIKIYHIKEGDYRENKQVTIDYCVDLIKKELNGIAN